MTCKLGGGFQAHHQEGLHVHQVGLGEINAQVHIPVEGAGGAQQAQVGVAIAHSIETWNQGLIGADGEGIGVTGQLFADGAGDIDVVAVPLAIAALAGGAKQAWNHLGDQQAPLGDGGHGITHPPVGAADRGLKAVGREGTDQLQHGLAINQQGGLGGCDRETGGGCGIEIDQGDRVENRIKVQQGREALISRWPVEVNPIGIGIKAKVDAVIARPRKEVEPVLTSAKGRAIFVAIEHQGIGGRTRADQVGASAVGVDELGIIGAIEVDAAAEVGGASKVCRPKHQ